jgi:hypothetical protein
MISSVVRRAAAQLIHPFDNNVMHKVTPMGPEWAGKWVPVCDSCVKGEHSSYGMNHLPNKPIDPEDPELSRYGCKNIGYIDEKRYQCHCNPAFEELAAALKNSC